jgi:hypothetical protein
MATMWDLNAGTNILNQIDDKSQKDITKRIQKKREEMEKMQKDPQYDNLIKEAEKEKSKKQMEIANNIIKRLSLGENNTTKKAEKVELDNKNKEDKKSKEEQPIHKKSKNIELKSKKSKDQCEKKEEDYEIIDELFGDDKKKDILHPYIILQNVKKVVIKIKKN